MVSKSGLRVLVLAGFLGVSAASADQIIFDASVPLQLTNFNTSVNVPKFDTSLGTLDKVTFLLDGYVEGTAKFESLDSEPATVEMTLAAMLSLQRPDLSSLVVSLPLVITSDNVTSYDFDIDFAGTSGKTYGVLSAGDSESYETTSPADLLLFSGVGFVNLPVMGDGVSSGNGAGNLLLQFSTLASADVRVIYDYTVPEPATAGLMSMGLLGLLRRKRRSA